MVVEETATVAAVGRLLILEDALEVVMVELDELAEVVKTGLAAAAGAAAVEVPVESV